MTYEKIIDELYSTIGMMLFNPLTGEGKTPDQLNEDDRITYDACMGAIEALKAMKPRVLSLDEVRNAYSNPMWFESKGTFRGQKGFWVLSKGVSPSYVIRLIPTIGKDDTQLSLAAYGKVWRCWTSRPDEKTREGTPWN